MAGARGASDGRTSGTRNRPCQMSEPLRLNSPRLRNRLRAVSKRFPIAVLTEATEIANLLTLLRKKMVLRERIELSTSPLPRECSTTELPQQAVNAADFCHKRRASASTDRPSCAIGWRHLAQGSHSAMAGAAEATDRPRVTMSQTPPSSDESPTAPDLRRDDRKARLAEQLRANLQRRKAQARSRRAGEADPRPEGLAAAPAQDGSGGTGEAG